MQTREDIGRQRATGRAWLRHAGAVLAALALNAGLMLYLASWSADIAAEERGPVRTLPVRVTDLEPPEEPLTEPDRRPTVSRQPARPTRVSLSQPAPPAMPSLATDVSVPALPTMDTPEVAFESDLSVPVYTPEAGAPSKLSLVAAVWTGETEQSGTGSGSSSPVLIRPPDLSAYYPYRARLKSITGQTEVRLEVDTEGSVADMEILTSEPPQVFDEAARRVCRTLRFEPARRNGRKVSSTVRLTLVWRLE